MGGTLRIITQFASGDAAVKVAASAEASKAIARTDPEALLKPAPNPPVPLR